MTEQSNDRLAGFTGVELAALTDALALVLSEHPDQPKVSKMWTLHDEVQDAWRRRREQERCS